MEKETANQIVILPFSHPILFFPVEFAQVYCILSGCWCAWKEKTEKKKRGRIMCVKRYWVIHAENQQFFDEGKGEKKKEKN